MNEKTEAAERMADIIQDLQEKLALSEAAGAEMRDALLAIQDPIDYCDKTGQNPHEPEWIRKKVFNALASDHGKAYLDVVRAAEKYHSICNRPISNSHLDDYLADVITNKKWFEEERAASKDLQVALDRLPGRKGV